MMMAQTLQVTRRFFHSLFVVTPCSHFVGKDLLRFHRRNIVKVNKTYTTELFEFSVGLYDVVVKAD